MQRFKLGAWGFVVGSIVVMIVGFSWGGWTTGSTAGRMAVERASAAVTTALVPVCVEKAKTDPAGAKKLAALKVLTSSYEQRDAVSAAGWATVGSGEPNREVAEACALALLKGPSK